jgi:hypothetical protein
MNGMNAGTDCIDKRGKDRGRKIIVGRVRKTGVPTINTHRTFMDEEIDDVISMGQGH